MIKASGIIGNGYYNLKERPMTKQEYLDKLLCYVWYDVVGGEFRWKEWVQNLFRSIRHNETSPRGLQKESPMTRPEYIEWFEIQTKKMLEITKAKNADYCGTGDDPFSNFTRVEVLGICSTEQGFLTRMFDKFSRIISFVQKGVLQVKDESVEDTLQDLSIYALLMLGYIVSKKEAAAMEQRAEVSPKVGL